MTKILLSRARQVVEAFPFPRAPRPAEISLFVAAHGTGQNQTSRDAADLLAQAASAQADYAEVGPVFLEDEPPISACYELARSKNIVLVPFFLGDGPHVREDIPVLLGEPKSLIEQRLKRGLPSWRNPTEKQGKRVWYAASMGTDAAVADIIVARVQEAKAEIRSPKA